MGLNVQVGEKYNLVYLHHQWSDEAHTLQFCSTGEYFETPEYELQSPLGDGVSLWYWYFDQTFVSAHSLTTELCPPNFGWAPNFGRIDRQDQHFESLRIFFGDRIYVYTLQEKYKTMCARPLTTSKILFLFFVTEFYGLPRWPSWIAWCLTKYEFPLI